MFQFYLNRLNGANTDFQGVSHSFVADEVNTQYFQNFGQYYRTCSSSNDQQNFNWFEALSEVTRLVIFTRSFQGQIGSFVEENFSRRRTWLDFVWNALDQNIPNPKKSLFTVGSGSISKYRTCSFGCRTEDFQPKAPELERRCRCLFFFVPSKTIRWLQSLLFNEII